MLMMLDLGFGKGSWNLIRMVSRRKLGGQTGPMMLMMLALDLKMLYKPYQKAQNKIGVALSIFSACLRLLSYDFAPL